MSQRRQQAEDTFRGKLASEAAASQYHEKRVQEMEEEERFLISELARAQEEQRKVGLICLMWSYCRVVVF